MAAEVVSGRRRTVAELRGDRRAFEETLDRWYSATVRLARAVSPDEPAARHAAREGWGRTIDQLPELDPNADVLVVLLRNTLEAVAAVLDQPTQLAGPAVPTDSFEAESSRWAGWWRGAPRDRASDNQRELLLQALRELAPAPGAVIALRDLEGLPESEVEAVLGFAPDAQRALLHAGRTAIWRALGP